MPLSSYRPGPNVGSCLLLTAVFFPAMGGLSQSAPRADAPPPAVNPAPTTQLPVVVVTGARPEEKEAGYRVLDQSATSFTGQPVLDTPFQVTTFSSELIRDQQARNLVEVTKNDPSIQAASTDAGFYDRIAVRGFYLFNAHRNGLAFNDQAQVPLENKAAIEVVKGMAALRYGFVSPGGIINYVTKRPTEEPLNRLNLYGTGFGTVGAHADVSRRFGAENEFGIRINGVLEDEHTFVDEVNGPRRMISAALDWRPIEALQFEVDFEHQYRELPQQAGLYNGIFAPGVDELKAMSRYDPQTFLGATWGTYPTWNTLWSARARYELNDQWAARLAFHRQDLLRDQNAVSPGFGTVQANGDYLPELYYSPNQERDTTVVEAAIEGTFETGTISHSLAFGYIFQEDIMTFPDGFYGIIPGRSNLYQPRPVRDPGATSDASYLAYRGRQSAFFLADTLEFTDWLEVFGGVRYVLPQFDSFERGGRKTQSYDEAVLTPSFGVVVKPAENLSLYASYAEGLEQGGQAPITASNPNEVMPPITSEQYEVGFKADLWKGTTFSAAAFHIDRGLEYLTSDNRYVQDGRQVHRGIEATLSGQITDELRVIVGGAYLDARVEEIGDSGLNGRRPQGVPEWQGNVFFDYDLSSLVKGLSVNTGVYMSGDKAISADNALLADGYARWDLGLRYRREIAGLTTTFRLNVLNVLDERYFENTQFGSYGFGAPRSVSFAVEVQF